MADKKISALTGASTPLAGTEVLPIVQSGSTVKVSVANLTAGRAVSALTLASTTGATFATTSGNVGINTSSPGALLQIGNEAESLPATYTGDIKLNSPLRTSLQGTGGIEFIVGGGGYCAKIQAISDSGASLSFGTRYGSASWTERMRIDSVGDVTNKTGNFVPGTAAKGINFTANTSAAGMTSKLLNDYEEGTWTPTDISGAALSFTTATGFYTKTGRLVVATFRIIFPATVNGSASNFAGLPYVSKNGGNQQQQGGGMRYTNSTLTFNFANPQGTANFQPLLNNGNAISNALFSTFIIDGMIVYQTA